MKSEIPQKGFVKLIVMIVILILVLSYFNFDLRSFVAKPIVQENLSYVWSLVKEGWQILVNLINKYVPGF